jgi:hypothetical protein
MRAVVVAMAERVFSERKAQVDYLVGTMIELPRAALRAGEIAEEAEFFSFGTNDLTQTALGISRDDAARFLKTYEEKGIYEKDPFVSIDRDGVGELVRIGCDARPGRAPAPEARRMRRTRRRSGLDLLLRGNRPRLCVRLPLPRARRTACRARTPRWGGSASDSLLRLTSPAMPGTLFLRLWGQS